MTTALVSEKLAAFIAPFEIPSNVFQKEAYDNLIQLDFPTTRNEYWKYTRVGKIQNSKLKIQKETKLTADVLKPFLSAANFIVLENGIFRADLSHISVEGVKVDVIKPAFISDETKFNSASQQHLFTALNATYFSELISISVAEKTVMNEALQLLVVTSGNAVFSNPRIVIDVHKYADAKFEASYVALNADGAFNNVVTAFFVAENAHVVYDKIQNENNPGFHISTEEVAQEKNSRFKINTMTLDGALVRNNINISVNGENCETHINGAVIAKETMHVDNHTFVNHRVPNCFSNENYKYVLDGKSTGVFNGRVIVQQHAQKINAYQKNANILLSDFAQINSKPELEIYADDVKCSHGSTTGQLDDDAVFYLQARGISKEKAKKLLVAAFIGEITEQISSDEVKKQVNRILAEKHDWML
ncbi:MAG: Fe-S cluster assembly protein SufD [Bacteroidetes bacterium]|nr:Fe-S cluster assembly protein SufD [Bacteroidota bacterium]